MAQITQAPGSDLVVVEADPIVLYDLIVPVKAVHFREHGRQCQNDYEKRMWALREGKPEQRLQKSRLARDIVRAILDDGTAPNIFGNGTKTFDKAGYFFPDYSEDEVTYTIGRLCQEGLVTNINHVFGPAWWGFESEDIIKKSRGGSGYDGDFVINTQLRDGLKELLGPYDHQTPQYEVLNELM